MLSEISNWIISIAGVICLSVIVELILPEGQMNKYIKSIFSFIIILVIILPLPKLLKSEIDLSNIFNYNQNIEADEDYLYQLNLDKLNYLQEEIQTNAHGRGYQNVKVYISADIFEKQLRIKEINVDLTNLVISNNAEHKDITKIKIDITNIIKSLVSVEEEVIFYEE